MNEIMSILMETSIIELRWLSVSDHDAIRQLLELLLAHLVRSPYDAYLMH